VSADIAVSADHVSKRFRLYHEKNDSLKIAVMRRGRARYEEFWALDDVSVEVPAGTTFGLIGENGSGKSTLLKCMAKILRPDKGSTNTVGKVSALLEVGAGFHPELSGRDNVYLNGSILGLSKKELDAKFDGIVEFAGLERFIDTPVKNYSSGMYVRLGFSVAINVNPDVLLIDEVLAVGDENFQRKCAEKLSDLQKEGKTIVVVSHALGTLRTMCETIAWLEHGHLKAIGDGAAVIDDYVAYAHRDSTTDAEGNTRWGSGEVRIETIEMLQGNGTHVETMRTGDDVTIRLHYKAAERIERPVFGVMIHTVSGIYLAGPNTREVGLVPDYIEGSGYVDFHVPNVPLLAGVYDLSASIYDYRVQHPYDHRQRALRFNVEAGTPHLEQGLVSLNAEWALDPATASHLP
jgi:ABC-2 type transport system ATP-binding protein